MEESDTMNYEGFWNGTLPDNQTAENTSKECLNEYCVSDDEYMDMIQEYIFPNPWEWLLVSLHLVVFVVGLVGNSLVCIAVYRNHSMRTVTNYFIVNLAVADFFVILICLPPTVLWDVTETWFLGNVLCKAVSFFQNVSVSVSILTLTFISVDRWYAICFPLKFKSTTQKAKAGIVIIWIVSITIATPQAITQRTISNRLPPHLGTILLTDCKYMWSEQVDLINTIVKSLLLYVLPLIFMSVAYYQISKVLWSEASIPGHDESKVRCTYKYTSACQKPTRASITRLNSRRGVTTVNINTTTQSQIQSRRKAAKMIVVVVIMFALCYFPVHSLEILRRWLPNNSYTIVLALFAHWLCYANSSMNPIIYNVMSGKFRTEFKRTFRCEKSDLSRDRSMMTMNTYYHSKYNTHYRQRQKAMGSRHD